jgi:hypothetical protein
MVLSLNSYRNAISTDKYGGKYSGEYFPFIENIG